MVSKEQIKEYLESEIGVDIQLLIAFTINKTKTTKDNEIVANVDEVIEIVTQVLSNINDLEPTDKEAKKAAVQTLEKVAKLTKTKWDDRAIAVLKPFIG